VRRTLAGAAGVVAMALFVVGAPARTNASPPGCAPAGPDTCTELLETLTVPASGAPVTTTTNFEPDQSYRLVFSGSVHDNNEDFDAFYCFGGSGCTPPHTCGVCLLFVAGGGLVSNAAPITNLGYNACCPTYSASHTYSLPYSKAAGPLKPLDGQLTFHVAALSPNPTGAFTIQVYGAVERPQKIRFAGSLSSRHVIGKGDAILLTAKVVGQMVVPDQLTDVPQAAKSAIGALTLSKLKLNRDGDLLVDYDRLALKVVSGKAQAKESPLGIDPGHGPIVALTVVVTRTADAKTCPLRTQGFVLLEDGAPNKRPDEITVSLPGCGGLHGRFVNRQAATVAVGISLSA
jgi:hypothetical protein